MTSYMSTRDYMSVVLTMPAYMSVALTGLILT
jgi:hypothetical protein